MDAGTRTVRRQVLKLLWPELEGRIAALETEVAAAREVGERDRATIAALRTSLDAMRARHAGAADAELAESVAGFGNRVPLSWVRSSQRVPFSNLGDAIAPVIVHAISGLPVIARAFTSPARRLVAVGTIAQAQGAGAVHLWGTGLDPNRRGFGDRAAPFAPAPGTSYRVHALRGPHSRRALLAQGIAAPPVYGDPAWFLPRVLPADGPKRWDLGVVLHISELAQPGEEAVPRPELRRYAGGEGDGVRLIGTYHAPGWPGFVAKLQEILACRRIVSTSFHGLILAEAYGIPCLYFPGGREGPLRLAVEGGRDPLLDHRFADFYRGAGRGLLAGYGQPAEAPARWDRVLAAVDRLWEPLDLGGEALFDAFPLPRRPRFEDARWPVDEAVLAALPW